MREFQNTQENDERVALALQQLRQHPTPHQQRLMDEIVALWQGGSTSNSSAQLSLPSPPPAQQRQRRQLALATATR